MPVSAGSARCGHRSQVRRRPWGQDDQLGGILEQATTVEEGAAGREGNGGGGGGSDDDEEEDAETHGHGSLHGRFN